MRQLENQERTIQQKRVTLFPKLAFKGSILTDITRDSCSIKTLDSIAEALGVKLVELFRQ